ncbi:MAG: hypothetical protein ACYS15_02890 [Planctomycetota bacterium]|jgi:hypothetical protein
MSEQRFNLRKALLRAALFLAWVFAVGTLGSLVIVAWAHWPGTGSTSHIMSVTVDGQDYGGLGFQYKGVAGLVLVLVEALVVASAIGMSVVPRKRWRRTGHLLLVVWAGLWLGNAVSIAQLGGGFVWALWIVLLGLFFLCTLLRAVRGWSTLRGSPSG